MRDARDRMKQGEFRAAWAAYQELYEQTGQFAAGYNAALLAFVLEGPDASILRLQQLQSRFPRPKVATALAKVSEALAPSRVDQIVVQVENENYQLDR